MDKLHQVKKKETIKGIKVYKARRRRPLLFTLFFSILFTCSKVEVDDWIRSFYCVVDCSTSIETQLSKLCWEYGVVSLG